MLTGNLEEFSLADVFRLLSLAKKTGQLEVVRQAGRGRVLFRRGDVIYAESSLVREPVGQKLVRAGAATEGQLRRALDQQAATGQRIGRILVESGAVAREALEAAIRSQTEEAIFDLLRWERGEFNWAPSHDVGAEVPLAVSVENLIMEASRRLDELEVIERKVPSLECVPAVAHQAPEGAVEINIAPEEWRLLVLVDGRRSLGEIARLAGYDDFGALKALYGLVSAGLVRILGGEEPPPVEQSEETSAPQLEPFSIEPHDLPPAALHERRPVSEEPAAERKPEETPEPIRADRVPSPASAAPPPREPEPVASAPTQPEASPTTPPEESPTTQQETGVGNGSNSRLRTGRPERPSSRDPAEAPRLDRSAAVRELAGLFSDPEPGAPSNRESQSPTKNPEQSDGIDRRKRVEDDDQVTRGLISKFIDGVKGL